MDIEQRREKEILVVEDNAADARLVVEWLKESSSALYSLTIVSTLADALCHAGKTEFHAVIADLALPDASGHGVVAVLRQALPAAALIILSGNEDEQAAFDTVRDGAQDYLVKNRCDAHHLRRALHYAMERKRLEMALAESESRFRDYAMAASDWFWEMAPDRVVNYVSRSFERATGIPAEWQLGKTIEEIASIDPSDPHWSAFLQALDEKISFQDLEHTVEYGGNLRHFRTSGVPFFDQSGVFRGYRGVGSDITDRWQLEERIHYLAHHDPLTELPNRALFEDRLQVAAAQCRRRAAAAAILFLDLDGFKAVNDEFGHEAGDLLLRLVAERLGECTREGDTLARIGGDEFAIIAEVHRDHAFDEAKAIAQRILACLKPPFALPHGEAWIGASIGASFYPSDGADIHECLRVADARMYAAKRNGKNRAVTDGR